MILYRILMLLALPVLLLIGARRGGLAQRLGRGPVPQGAIWIHGASNGELTSAKALVSELAARGDRVLVTSNSVTARTMVEGWAIAGVTARLAPFDLPFVQSRFFRSRALIVVENELWPERILGCHKRGIPVMVVGAKMSERSARRWARIPLMARILGALDWVSAQDAAGEARLLSLGLAANKLGPRLNLKAGALAISAGTVPLPCARARTLLAASTHEGEDAPILQAFAAQNRFDWLILAPRHPKRGDAIAGLARAAGLHVAQRSKGDPPGGNVYIADTLGEMPLWYDAAAVTIIGGSFVPKGGHTPFEPAAHGSALIHGPHVENFADVFAKLDAAKAAVATGAAGLAQALDLLDEARIIEMTAAAKTLQPDHDSMAPIMDALDQLMAARR
ncbi:3-deoxy-D-manno-octulosonic acid transferase [Falsirhodobacter sp. alg1]|uniref:3-deoxy-D-manno-octulosonic acid transferase n=1 Tax=Falsirhodobacter sp. alg1 TaxID=1472418 RepID=UPI0005EF13E4|nr:glycosyltransferase N-terminal domain-containing protein [Falsirhodobacter sp. alg1]